MMSVHRGTDARSLGWLASFGLHGALACGALVLTQNMTLAPQPPAFTWRVAMVSPPSDAPQSPGSPSTPVHPPVRTSSPGTPSLRASSPPAGVSSAATVSTATSTAHEPKVQRDEVRSPLSADVLASPQPLPPSPLPTLLRQSEGGPAGPDLGVGSARHDLLSSQEAGSPIQTSTVASVATSTARPDYAWLSETILRRMEELKRYPADARLDRLEGKVVLKAILKSDGNVEAVEVFRSSGHESLDRAAVELLNLAAPFRFPHALGKPQMTVKIPMSYNLAP